MKFNPQPRSSGEHFCLDGLTRHSKEQVDVCAECDAEGTVAHMYVNDSKRYSVALCRTCYEAYRGLIGLQELVGV